MAEQLAGTVARHLTDLAVLTEALIQQLDFHKTAVKETLQTESTVQSTARRLRQARLALEDDSLLRRK